MSLLFEKGQGRAEFWNCTETPVLKLILAKRCVFSVPITEGLSTLYSQQHVDWHKVKKMYSSL